MTDTKLKPAVFKHIESELYDYPGTKREIQRLREQIIYGSTIPDENIGGGRASEPGRPTERIATRLATNKRLESLEEIRDAIYQVYCSASPEHKDLIRLRYWERTDLSWYGIADRLCVSRRQALRWRNAIVERIAEVIGW